MHYINNKKLREQLEAFNIDPEKIKEVHLKMQSGVLSPTSYIYDKTMLRAPQPNDYDDYAQLEQQYFFDLGVKALEQGELAVFWLNGGAATRYFNLKKISPEEKIKYQKELAALTPEIMKLPKGVTPTFGEITYLELKILNLIKITKELKLTKPIKVILMNSFVTDAATENHLQELLKKYSPLIVPEQFFKVLQKPLFPRFTFPKDIKDIDVYLGPDEKMSFAPCGHGDFLHLIKDFFRGVQWPEVKHLFFANIDNFGTTIRPEILGYHISKQKGRTVELAAKLPGDKGGAPCFVNGHLVIVEQMKFPEDFAQDQITAFNTNSFWFTLKDLLTYEEELPLILADKTIPETGEEVLQLEHFACDINLPSNFLELPRKLRFWPTKRYVDLLIYKQDPDFQNLLKAEYGLDIAK